MKAREEVYFKSINNGHIYKGMYLCTSGDRDGFHKVLVGKKIIHVYCKQFIKLKPFDPQSCELFGG